MARMVREITLELTVTVPAATGESEVENRINCALDETPETGNDWTGWMVGAARITGVSKRRATAEETDAIF